MWCLMKQNFQRLDTYQLFGSEKDEEKKNSVELLLKVSAALEEIGSASHKYIANNKNCLLDPNFAFV